MSAVPKCPKCGSPCAGMPAIVMAFSSIQVGRLRGLTTIAAIRPRLASGNITGLLGSCLTATWKSTLYLGYRSDR